MTGGSKVLLLSVKKDTGEERFFEEKDSLANRKEESQSKVTKRKKKKVGNGKFLLEEKIHILRQLTVLHQQKRKRKPNVGDIINQHRHLFQLPAIQVPMRNRIK